MPAMIVALTTWMKTNITRRYLHSQLTLNRSLDVLQKSKKRNARGMRATRTALTHDVAATPYVPANHFDHGVVGPGGPHPFVAQSAPRASLAPPVSGRALVLSQHPGRRLRRRARLRLPLFGFFLPHPL